MGQVDRGIRLWPRPLPSVWPSGTGQARRAEPPPVGGASGGPLFTLEPFARALGGHLGQPLHRGAPRGPLATPLCPFGRLERPGGQPLGRPLSPEAMALPCHARPEARVGVPEGPAPVGRTGSGPRPRCHADRAVAPPASGMGCEAPRAGPCPPVARGHSPFPVCARVPRGARWRARTRHAPSPEARIRPGDRRWRGTGRRAPAAEGQGAQSHYGWPIVDAPAHAGIIMRVSYTAW